MKTILRPAPSPLYSGERAGVRGDSPELRPSQKWPLTLTLSPEYGREGTRHSRTDVPVFSRGDA